MEYNLVNYSRWHLYSPKVDKLKKILFRIDVNYFEWNSLMHNLQLQQPSGGDVSGGVKQYTW